MRRYSGRFEGILKIGYKYSMPVYDMKCPRCGKQSTEYDENKWQCLTCGWIPLDQKPM